MAKFVWDAKKNKAVRAKDLSPLQYSKIVSDSNIGNGEKRVGKVRLKPQDENEKIE